MNKVKLTYLTVVLVLHLIIYVANGFKPFVRGSWSVGKFFRGQFVRFLKNKAYSIENNENLYL